MFMTLVVGLIVLTMDPEAVIWMVRGHKNTITAYNFCFLYTTMLVNGKGILVINANETKSKGAVQCALHYIFNT